MGKDPTERAAGNSLESGLTRGQTKCRQPGTEPQEAGGKAGASQGEVHRSDLVGRTKTPGECPRPGPQTDLRQQKGLCGYKEDKSTEIGRRSWIPWGGGGGAVILLRGRGRQARERDGRRRQRLEYAGDRRHLL